MIYFPPNKSDTFKKFILHFCVGNENGDVHSMCTLSFSTKLDIQVHCVSSIAFECGFIIN